MKIASRVGLGLALLSVFALGAVGLQRKCGGDGRSGGVGEGPRFSVEMLPGDPGAETRFAAKAEVAERLCSRRLTLLEAAAWFAALNRTPEPCGYDPLVDVPGASPGEKVCRQAIRWARSAAEKHSASEGEAVEQRLEAELQAQLDRNGTVELPVP